MKKNLLATSLLAASCVLGVSSQALATDTTASPAATTTEQHPAAAAATEHHAKGETVIVVEVPVILERLAASGYSGVHEIKLDHDVYEIEGWNAQGHKFKLEVDAKKGQVPAAEGSKVKMLTLLEIANNLQKAGYTHITKMEMDDGKCIVKAQDSNGKHVKLKINPTTGEIMK